MLSSMASFPLLSAIELTASAALMTAVVAFALSDTPAGRLRAAALVGAWFLIVITLGATSALDAEHGAGIIGLGLAVLLPLGLLSYFLLGHPAPRAVDLVPLPVLIGANALRLLGADFLVLHAAHELPAPFAPVAGWGDIVVGATAIPLAFAAARHAARVKPWLWAWNALGALDLVTALALGASSSPGPLRLFIGPPSSAAMTSLPWIVIPGFLVPIFLALHGAIFVRLHGAAGASRAAAWSAPGYR